MDGVLKNIKIGDYILYAKRNYEGRRRKIYPRKRLKLGIFFWLAKSIYLCFMQNKIKTEGRRKRVIFNVIYE
jgi:hypothetical protein